MLKNKTRFVMITFLRHSDPDPKPNLISAPMENVRGTNDCAVMNISIFSTYKFNKSNPLYYGLLEMK